MWGVRVAQWVKCLTLGFRSGHDLRPVGASPTSGSLLHEDSDSLCLSVSLPSPPHSCTLSKKKLIKKKLNSTYQKVYQQNICMKVVKKKKIVRFYLKDAWVAQWLSACLGPRA